MDQEHIYVRLEILETNCTVPRTISPAPSLLVAQKAIHLLPGKHGEILGRLEVGWEKVASWSTKAAISLKRVKIEEKLLSVMLVLGLGLGLKAKFCGLGLGLAIGWPWPWPWNCGLGLGLRGLALAKNSRPKSWRTTMLTMNFHRLK